MFVLSIENDSLEKQCRKLTCILTVYTQSPAGVNFHIYFNSTYSPNRVYAFETEIQRQEKESTYFSLLSDC